MTNFERRLTAIRKLLRWRVWIGCLLIMFLTATGQAAEGPLKICLLSASAEYESDKSLAAFQTYLERSHQVVCTRVSGQDKGTGLPGLEALDKADLIIVFTRRVTLPPDQLGRVKNYLASGRPVIGLRTASHAFQNYLEFDKEVQGGGYVGHYSNGVARVSVAVARGTHPILAGFTPFDSRKLYQNPTLGDDVAVLLEGTMGDVREPVAWTRQHNGGRVFYTSLGTPEDFQQESFRRLLVNAIFWTTKRDPVAMKRALPPPTELRPSSK